MAPDDPGTFVIDTDNITKSETDYVIEPRKPKYNLEYARALLIGLQRKPIYSGTVTPKTKEQRRVRNRIAKATRKRNR